MSLLSVDDVTVRLGDATVLAEVSLSVERGEFVGLVGPNGAGKTTLLRAINGVQAPDAGTVRVEGDALADCSTKEWSRRLATVPQDTSVSFAFRVEDVVEMGRTPHRSRTQFGGSETDRRRIEDALDRTETATLRERPIDELSGGERQRVFVARALAQDTPLLVLDEPTASLDVNHQVEILQLVRTLIGDGRGALAAIHDLDLAARFCDRIALLYDGQIQAIGSPGSVLETDALEPAFDTSAAVSTNPVTGTPTVTAGADPNGDGCRVHVVGGGRVGARAIATLTDAGHSVTAGVLREGDLAAETARALDVPVATTSTAGPADPDAIADAHDLANDAPITVLADVTVGPRQWTLDLADGACSVVLIEGRPRAERLQGGPRADERYERIGDRSVSTGIDDLPNTVTEANPSIESAADD